MTTFILYREYFRTGMLDILLELPWLGRFFMLFVCEGVKGVKGGFETFLI